MIVGIRITNFDVFEDELLGRLIGGVNEEGNYSNEGIRLRNVNALIGRNNTGKTSFLMAMSFIKRVINQGASQASTLDGRPGFSNLVMDKSKPSSFKIYFKLKDATTRKPKYVQYELDIMANEFGSPEVIAEKVLLLKKVDGKDEVVDCLSMENGKGIVRDNDGKATEAAIGDIHLSALSVYGKISIYETLYQVHNEIDGWFFCRFSSEISNTYYLDGNAPGGHKHLSSSGANVNNVLEYMEKQNSAYYERVIEEITSKIPQMKKKPTMPGALESSPDKLFLYLLLLKDQEPNTTIFMETPDKDLYHDMVDVLGDEMREFALSHPYNQIIFTTHNPYIVEHMSPNEIWCFKRSYGEEDSNVKITCAGNDPVVVALSKEGVGMGAIWYGGHLDSDEGND
ncbi:MAG: AAA family ATPase [Saccharofermentans sp.]|nr:AAA family ATPase [Saccharofermentans sp.]